MKINNFLIDGLFLIKPDLYHDERGYFFESYNKNRYEKEINTESFVQDDHSFSTKNVLRGIHLQVRNPQAQLLYLVTGKIFIVFVDFRPKSKTFLKHVGFDLSFNNHNQIYMSPGIGCAFYTKTDSVNVIYKISKLYGDTEDIGFRWDDPDLNILWPTENPILSKKDSENYYLKDIDLNQFKDLVRL